MVLKTLGKSLTAKIIAGVLSVAMVAGGAAGIAVQANAVPSFDIASAGTDSVKKAQARTAQVYSAYLDLLESKRDAVDRYNWQRRFYGAFEGAGDLTSRPVVLCDVYGDELPELIYLDASNASGTLYGYTARLNVLTVENGKLRTLYTNSHWDAEAQPGGRSEYYLYQLKGDKTLYVFTTGGDSYLYRTYSALQPADGWLAESEKYYYKSSFDVSAGGQVTYKTICRKDGKTDIPEDEYDRAVSAIRSDTASILMFSTYTNNFEKDFVEANGCPALTCDQAIAFLKEKISQYAPLDETPEEPDLSRYGIHYTDPSGGVPADDRSYQDWSGAYHSFVTEKQFLESGDPSLGYSDLDAKYSDVRFALRDINNDNTPELLICNGFNGRDLRAEYVFTFSGGRVIYCGKTSADTYAVKGYPGLFTGVMQSGWYLDPIYQERYLDVTILSHITLNNNMLERERVSLTGTLPDTWEKETIYQTDNAELLAASQKEPYNYPSLSWSELTDLGWDSFLFYCLGEDGNTRLLRVKFDDTRSVDLNWGWGLFGKDASEYDHNLAVAGLILSQAAELSQQDAEQRLKALGFPMCSSVFYGGSGWDQDMPATTFGFSKQDIGGKTYIVASVAVRGSADAGDWVTNAGSVVTGFYYAADNIREKFREEYAKLKTLYSMDVGPDNTILFITGHSQGGAVAGQLAQMLEGQFARRGKIFTYTFASPNYQTFEYDADAFTNVHNIINVNDVVPTVPWGYDRYGHDWFCEPEFRFLLNPVDQIIWNHLLSTYLDFMITGLPKNMGDGAVNLYSRSSARCPVDISVTDKKGTLLAWTQGPDVFFNGSPKVLVYTEGDAKFVVAPPGVEYDILFTGTDKGTMTYTQQTVNAYTQQTVSEQTFADVPVTEGAVYGASADKAAGKAGRLYLLGSDGKAVSSIAPDGRTSAEHFGSPAWGWTFAAITAVGAALLIFTASGLIRDAKKKKETL